MSAPILAAQVVWTGSRWALRDDAQGVVLDLGTSRAEATLAEALVALRGVVGARYALRALRERHPDPWARVGVAQLRAAYARLRLSRGARPVAHRLARGAADADEER